MGLFYFSSAKDDLLLMASMLSCNERNMSSKYINLQMHTAHNGTCFTSGTPEISTGYKPRIWELWTQYGEAAVDFRVTT